MELFAIMRLTTVRAISGLFNLVYGKINRYQFASL
jgi:hypothetical protein